MKFHDLLRDHELLENEPVSGNLLNKIKSDILKFYYNTANTYKDRIIRCLDEKKALKENTIYSENLAKNGV